MLRPTTPEKWLRERKKEKKKEPTTRFPRKNLPAPPPHFLSPPRRPFNSPKTPPPPRAQALAPPLPLPFDAARHDPPRRVAPPSPSFCPRTERKRLEAARRVDAPSRRPATRRLGAPVGFPAIFVDFPRFSQDFRPFLSRNAFLLHTESPSPGLPPHPSRSALGPGQCRWGPRACATPKTGG